MIGTRPLTDNEVNAILTQVKKPRDRALILIGLSTGLRISEILQLKKRDFKCGGEFTPRVYVDPSRMKGGKKGRVVYLDKRAACAVQKLLKRRTRSAWLFHSKAGHLQRNRAHNILKGYARAAGIDTDRVSCHSLRKTFATNAYHTFGKNLSMVQAVMGHENINNTMKYIPECGEFELWKSLHLTRSAGSRKKVLRNARNARK